MSNPAVYLLHQNRIHGNVLRIEDNLGEAIHIHYGDSRFSITVKEFEEMCDAIEKAAKELFELEGLDWEQIDKSALDWNWLCDYEMIDKITLKHVRLGDLYTKKNIYLGDGFQRTVKLKDSMFVEELSSKNSDIDKYVECNMFGQSNRDRLQGMYEKIANSDYPFDGKYISVNSANVIFDGDHRAACLYVKHGPQYEIPVIEIAFKNQKSIEDILKEENKKFTKFIIKTALKKAKRIVKNAIKRVCGKSTKIVEVGKMTEAIDIDKLYAWLHDYGENYYFVENNTLIVENVDELKKEFRGNYELAYRGYRLLYSISAPIILKTNFGDISVWDRLCCKSRFENSLLPLDKLCNEYAWSTSYTDTKGIKRASVETEIIYIIVSAFLERLSFSEDEKKKIQTNISILDNKDIQVMLEKEFFGYSEKLVSMLKQEKYDECIRGYITNTSY